MLLNKALLDAAWLSLGKNFSWPGPSPHAYKRRRRPKKRPVKSKKKHKSSPRSSQSAQRLFRIFFSAFSASSAVRCFLERPRILCSFTRVVSKSPLIRHHLDLIAFTDKPGIQSLIAAKPFHIIQYFLAARIGLGQWCRAAAFRDR